MLTSPAAIQRAQLAVLDCIISIAGCTAPAGLAGVHGCGCDVLIPEADILLQAAADHLSNKAALAMRERATTAFMALATVDPDATWLLLSAALAGSRGLKAVPHPPSAPEGLPTVEQLMVQLLAGDVAFASPGLQDCSAAKLQSMLDHVQAMAVPWHSAEKL